MSNVVLPDTSKLKDYEHPEIAERFYRETAYHRMTILHDDGLYRHIRMMPRKDKGSSYWYDVITWPHNLVFRGDGESFAFSRVEDMFKFFRSGIYKDGSIHINASYWAEKLTSNRECAKSYDQDGFTKYIGQMILESEEDYPGLTDAWNDAVDGWSASYDISHQEGAWEALNNFSYGPWHKARCSCGKESAWEEHAFDAKAWARDNGHQDRNGFEKPGHKVDFVNKDAFTFDPYDMDFKDYDWWFLWSLYGIVKAIKAYDEVKGSGVSVDVAGVGKAVIV